MTFSKKPIDEWMGEEFAPRPKAFVRESLPSPKVFVSTPQLVPEPPTHELSEADEPQPLVVEMPVFEPEPKAVIEPTTAPEPLPAPVIEPTPQPLTREKQNRVLSVRLSESQLTEINDRLIQFEGTTLTKGDMIHTLICKP